MFSEKRLVYRQGGEKPRPREMAQQAKEVPANQMMPLAKKFIKNMLTAENGLDKRKFGKLIKQPDQQQKIIQKWMEDHALDRKSKSNIMGTDTVTEYYLGSKKINTQKAAKEVHAFLKEKANQKKILKEIRKERKSETTTSSSETAEGFKEDNRWPSQRAANIASKFYSKTLQKAIKKAMQLNSNVQATKVTPGNVKQKINKVLKPGAHIADIRENWGIDSENIKFNGPKAWPMINSPIKRRRLRNQVLRSIG